VIDAPDPYELAIAKALTRQGSGSEDPMNTLPVSIETEKAALGAVLLDPKQLETVLQFATIEDFSLSSHREILRTMARLDDHGVPPDLVTVATELEQTNTLESTGGRAYIAALIDGVPDRPNPEAYAAKIHDLARARALHAAAALACSSIEQGESIDEVLGRLQRRELELIRTKTRGARSIKAAALDFLNQFCAACNADGPDIEFTTSVPDLDSKTGGLQGLVIVGGQAAENLLFLQQMAFAQAKEGRRVYFATLETVGGGGFTFHAGIVLQPSVRVGTEGLNFLVAVKQFVDHRLDVVTDTRE
jgi:replicative DNA helicase